MIYNINSNNKTYLDLQILHSNIPVLDFIHLVKHFSCAYFVSPENNSLINIYAINKHKIIVNAYFKAN